MKVEDITMALYFIRRDFEVLKIVDNQIYFKNLSKPYPIGMLVVNYRCIIATGKPKNCFELYG